MNKSYCFVNFNELIIKNALTNEEIDLEKIATELKIPKDYQYMVMVFNSKFNGPSFWSVERNQIYEYTTGHLFDASKSKLIKKQDSLFISNIKSVTRKNNISFSTFLEFKTIHDVGQFFDKLILNNEYDNYRALLQEVLYTIIIDDEDEIMYDNMEMKRKRSKLVC